MIIHRCQVSTDIIKAVFTANILARRLIELAVVLNMPLSAFGEARGAEGCSRILDAIHYSEETLQIRAGRRTAGSRHGKRTQTGEFPTKGRGTKGVIAMATTAKNGPLVGAVQVSDGDEIMLISDQGTAVRTRVDEISVLGRNTQGVRVIKTRDDEKLVRLSRIAEDDADEAQAEAPIADGAS